MNIRRVAELDTQGRMQAAGRAAFAARSEARSRWASYEQSQDIALQPTDLATFRRHAAAWRFFEAAPPGYRRRSIWRIVSAKRPETQARRLAQLIAACAEGRQI